MSHQSDNKSSLSGVDNTLWENLKHHPSVLPGEELIVLYDQLRNDFQMVEGGRCYNNLKHLYATPFEREKDRVEQALWQKRHGAFSDVVAWYRYAKDQSCRWWLENHVIAKHSFTSCMSCGACTALCPAAEFYEFSPREIMTIVQEKNEESIIALLKSEMLWYCHQCGSCKTKCPRENSPFGIISSLRLLSQFKGYHVESTRGRQQYFARHLWGGNLWNRACTLYFRNAIPDTHQDFGPRFKTYFSRQDEYMKRVGAHPDMEGALSGRKIPDETLDELRRLWLAGGAVFLWALIDKAAQKQSEEMNLSIDDYFVKIKTEG